MHEPTYRQAAVHSWKLVWHHKNTWILGLLSLLVGQFGLTDFIGQLIAKFVSNDASWWPTSWGVIRITTLEQFFWFGWAMVILASVVLFVVAAAVCAQGALIAMSVHWYNRHVSLSFKRAWQVGVQHFWRILSINVLEKLLLGVILNTLVGAGGFFSTATTAGLVLTIIIVGLGIFLALAISVVAVYALGYVVVEDRPVTEAVERAWRLFDRHLLVSFELSALLVLVNLLFFAVAYLGAVIALIPSFLISLTAGFTGYLNLLSVSIGVYLVLVLIVAAIVGAVFTAFTTSAWMYLFLKMYHEGVASRLVHWARKLVTK